MLERIADLYDVRDLVLAHLAEADSGVFASGEGTPVGTSQKAAPFAPYIVCARDFPLQMPQTLIPSIASELQRNWEVRPRTHRLCAPVGDPCIVAVRNLSEPAQGDLVLMDAFVGSLATEVPLKTHKLRFSEIKSVHRQ